MKPHPAPASILMKTTSAFTTATALLALAVAGTSGCQRSATPAASTPASTAAATPAAAIARLEPTQGNNVRGTVNFKAEGNGVRVTADITGLTPGEHGFHVHEKGDCSAPDGSSAGAHFNPTNQPHGAREADARHVGDLGNLVADANGRAQLNYVDSKLALSGPNSIVGRAVIVHAKADDLKSQPSGEAGGRVACGVIQTDAGGR